MEVHGDGAMTNRTRSEYVFDRAEDQRELERLRAIEQVVDPASRRRLSETGLSTGWHCLEVGPGAGSIMTWMGEVVGPTGQVLAIDLSPRFLSDQNGSNVQIRQDDIRTAALPPRSFDLVHARYVLIHMPDHKAALDRMLDCLKPGGWLVLEEPDFSASRGITGPEEDLGSVQRVNQAIERMYSALGMDFMLGLKLPSLLQRRGLRTLMVEHDVPLSVGGSGMAMIMRLSAVQLRQKYLATGVVAESDLDRYCRFADNPETWAVYYATVAVSGQKKR
jgi:SAM-dependent methyltransferase